MISHRRSFLRRAGALAMAAALPTSLPAATERPKRLRIAVEEHFVSPELLAEWQRMLASGQPLDPGFVSLYRPLFANPASKGLLDRLLDVGSGRIEAMDRAGISMQLLSLTSPGVQLFDAAAASAAAARSNDQLAKTLRDAPAGRYAGLGAFAPQDPARAAREIERCVRELGFCGMLINSHTHNEYLDAPKFAPIFEALQAHDVPLYLHPQTPSEPMHKPYADYGLLGPAWGFAAETGLHATRILFSGLLEEFPRLKIVLGHLGEGVPWWLARMDSRFKLTLGLAETKPRRPLTLIPSEYFKRNFYVTLSGMTDPHHLAFSLDVLGADRVLFATDYPYEPMEPVVDTVEQARLTDVQRDMILHQNALKLFRLAVPAAVA